MTASERLTVRCSEVAAELAVSLDFEPGKITTAQLILALQQAVNRGADLGIDFAEEVITRRAMAANQVPA